MFNSFLRTKLLILNGRNFKLCQVVNIIWAPKTREKCQKIPKGEVKVLINLKIITPKEKI